MFGLKKKAQDIYADHAAGSPTDVAVREAMAPWLDASWNPSAIHPRGVKAREAIDTARKEIAGLLAGHADEITFTSSGTEALHTALHSLLSSWKGEGLPTIVTTSIEHHALLEPLKQLEKEQRIILKFLTLLPNGVVDPDSLKPLLHPSTLCVAVMYANNEIGTIQPIRELTKIIRAYKKDHQSSLPYMITDACQVFSFLECHIPRLGVDYLVLNGAKVSGPQGIGLLYHRRGVPSVPVFLGGGQEAGKRAGTENVAAIVGFARALQIAQEKRQQHDASVRMLRDSLEKNILSLFPDAHVNGSGDRLAGHLSVTFPGANHEYLALALGQKGIMVGTKSACRENDEGDSHALAALRSAGDASDLLAQGLRISLGDQNTARDIERITSVLKETVPLALASITVAKS